MNLVVLSPSRGELVGTRENDCIVKIPKSTLSLGSNFCLSFACLVHRHENEVKVTG
jgi:hypothetical protein